MRPGRYALTIYQGSTFRLVITWKDSAGNPVNLTGYSARLQIRRTVESPDVLEDWDSAVPGEITLGGAAGTITILVPATATAAMTWRSGVYDLELTSPGSEVVRLLEGVATVVPEVTR